MEATEIQISRTDAEPGTAAFRVEVPHERVERAEQDAAREFARRAKLPGFRKGKAPLAVIRKRYHDAIREQVLREVIGESWKTALDREPVEPIADPHVHELTFESGRPLTFELHVEVKPEITLERTGGFTLTRSVRSVTDDDVERQIEELQRQRAPWVPVEEPRAPAAGELADITLATREDGDAKDEKRYQVVLGEGQAIPDVEQQIMQLTPGQTADAEVKFPQDFSDPARRGQARSVRLTLHEVKRLDLAPLDDDFAREVGDFESMAQLRQAIRDDLDAEARREADAGLRRELIEAIASANDVVTPRPLVQRLLRAYAQAYRVPDDQFERFATEFTPIAEAQVRRDLIIDHVARAADLEATEENLDARIAEIAERRGTEPGEIYTSLQKAKRLTELERSLTEEKVFAHLLEQSTITDT